MLADTRAAIRMAFDSVRTIDEYGRLHVKISNISKANVCPYRGAEIPGYESLGLEPGRVYMLLRHPAELARAAPTFDGLPLMSEHIPHSANEPQQMVVVGTTGTDAAFVAPYLRNSLTVWDGTAIELIESDDQKELSAGYGYVPDMTPGVYEGVRYDGVMRNIIGNHVALVQSGRAGADVVVGDSKPQELPTMTVTKGAALSRKAAMAAGALETWLRPKLAQDHRIDLKPILLGTTARNWTEKKPVVIRALQAAAKGKLAQDADLAELVELLDKLDGDNGGMTPDDDDLGIDTPPDDKSDDKPPAMPAAGDPPVPADLPPADGPPDPAGMDPVDKALAFLKDLIRPEDIAMVQHILKPAAPPAAAAPAPAAVAGDTPLPTPGAPMPPGAEKDKPISQGAMDRAIAAAVKANETATIARINAIHAAKTFVRPWVGELAIAQDSAEGVYKLALDTLGVADLDDVHPSAYRAILSAQPKPGDNRPRRAIAQDANPDAGFAARFPNAAKLRVI